jgi:hypothetical protein
MNRRLPRNQAKKKTRSLKAAVFIKKTACYHLFNAVFLSGIFVDPEFFNGSSALVGRGHSSLS